MGTPNAAYAQTLSFRTSAPIGECDSIRHILGLASKVRNPTHGSGWIFQIRPTLKARLRFLESHQRELVDGFRSNLLGESALKRLNNSARLFLRQDLNNPPTAVGGIQEAPVTAACRLDLNHPPTTVGGIFRLLRQGRSEQVQPASAVLARSWRKPRFAG